MSSSFRSTDHLVLSQSEIFQDLDVTTLTSVLQRSFKKQSKSKEQLILQSQANTSVYFILFGCVKITSIAADGRERISELLGVGDIFGEITTLHDGPSYASVVTLVPCVFVVMDQSNFKGLLHSHPEMSLKLLRIFAKKIEKRDGFINDLVFSDVNSRLAKHLLSMLNVPIHNGFVRDAAIAIRDDRRCQSSKSIRISQQDLANMVGVSRESVNKHLKVWERDGIISLSTGLIDVCNIDRLAALVKKNTGKL